MKGDQPGKGDGRRQVRAWRSWRRAGGAGAQWGAGQLKKILVPGEAGLEGSDRARILFLKHLFLLAF